MDECLPDRQHQLRAADPLGDREPGGHRIPDGVRGGRARSTVGDNVATVDEELQYYGVYQVTRGRVGLTTPELRLVPGEVASIDVELDNRITGARAGRVDGTIGVVPHLPSLTSDVVAFQVPAGGRQTVSLTLTARDDLDWGEKTVVFDVEVAGRHSYFWRTLTVQRLPKLAVRPGVIEAGSKRVSVRSAPFPWAKTATAEAVRLEPMTPFERKIIHDAIATIDGVTSESEGVEPKRFVVILPA